MANFRLGVDVGGTHTDLVLAEPSKGTLLIEKIQSTPDKPSKAVLNGLKRLLARDISPNAIEFFSHGTTVTTNALLEMKGAKIGLLITEGFRAIQEVQSQARESNQFELKFQRPVNLVSQKLTKEINGRINYAGEEITPLDEDAVRQAVQDLHDEGVVSYAICYVFSYMNPTHEKRTAEIIRSEVQGALVSLSSEVLPRIREWPRMSTTMLNAYLEPILNSYCDNLNKGLDTATLTTLQRFLMQSNGGVMPLIGAASNGKTVHTLLSGPAAGVQATGYIIGEKQGWSSIVTMDMGGTSCDIAFIQNSKPLEVTEGMIAGRRLDLPALDISTISAGGGTIARLTAAKFIRVGPESAGAEPGPVCYGKGGNQPTVTDADLVCGFLNPLHLLGGKTILDRNAAKISFEKNIAEPLGMSVELAAAGVLRLINARMADEIREQAAKKVIDLTEFTLVPFGGAGPVHAAMVADEIGIQRILVPPNPGAFSALGLLCSDIVHDYIRSEICEVRLLTPNHAESIFSELEENAKKDLKLEGLKGEIYHFIRELDLRYAGQGYEIRTPLSGLKTQPIEKSGLIELQKRFHDLHHRLHGHSAHDQEIEVVSYRLRVRVPVPKFNLNAKQLPTGTATPIEKRSVSYDGKEFLKTPVYARESLTTDFIEGPAIIEQFDSTTVLPPNWRAKLDKFANIIAEKET